MIRRFSSRTHRLDHAFLRERLRNARTYRRIAGYFRSSLFELVHEELEGVDRVQVVCNADLDPRDLAVARSAQEQALALKEKWNERPPESESVLAGERYRRLHDLLVRGNLEVRVVGRSETAFLHGKAGVIEGRDGRKTSFLGSVNETREAWRDHYELVWEDDSAEAVAWVEEEFDHLWAVGVPLPQAIIDEIDRCARRVELARVEDCPPPELAAAAMAEAPIYRRGEALMPWQQAFVGIFLEHRDAYGSARLLLADEVGVGKTLSVATSAVLASLLGDGPVLVLCPATLAQQWQTELLDKLGVPAAVWTNKKTWLDPSGHHIKTRGPEDCARCPFQIGIVSTGLIFHQTPERQHLLERRYGAIVLDEAHRARRGRGPGKTAGQPNNLLSFMLEAAKQTRHVILATATPVQTDIAELWDLLEVLNRGAEHVLGRVGSPWRDMDRVLDLVTGARSVSDEAAVWELVRNPLPPRQADPLFDHVRADLDLDDTRHETSRPVTDLNEFTRRELQDKASEREGGITFFQRCNPILRHTVLRKRATLEDRGLLPRIAVDIHPNGPSEKPFFDGLGLLTTPPIEAAYEAAEDFTRLLGKRTRAAGFLKSLLLQRICSSLASGLRTTERLLAREMLDDDDDQDNSGLSDLTNGERECLERLRSSLLERPEDPKLRAVTHYLLETSPRWLDLGAIVFSQFFDTAAWVAESLADRLPDEPIALYAGADRSAILHGARRASVEREVIKRAVKERDVRLVVATDAACEGLNLQTLGTLINVDLPWNPSRLEQRIGRIKRFGQARTSVDMLNLVYRGTVDEVVYERLSRRMRDRFDLFGSLPDVIEDDWIADQEILEERLSEFIERRGRANAFDVRYSDTVDPKGQPWERCSQVLARRDIVERLSRGW